MKSIRFWVLFGLLGAVVGLAAGVAMREFTARLDRIAAAVEALNILGRRQ